MKISLAFLGPFMDTIRELADSKRAMIFMLAVIFIAQADQVGFPGVSPKLRLAAAVGLVAVWIVCQTVTDIFGNKEPEPKVIADSEPKKAEISS